jgi:hypothetical protein
MVMYSDNNTWKQHYDDWKHIVNNSEINEGVTELQYGYRIKTIMNLIRDYESSNPSP